MEHKVNFGSAHSLTGEIVCGVTVSQTFSAEAATLTAVHITFATYKRNNNARLKVEILTEAGASVASFPFGTNALRDNQSFRVPIRCALTIGQRYILRLESTDGKPGQSVTAKFGKKAHTTERFNVDGVRYPNGELFCSFEYDTAAAQPEEKAHIVVNDTGIVFPDRVSVCIILDKDDDANDTSGLTFLQEMVQSLIEVGNHRQFELVIADWKKSKTPVKSWIYAAASCHFPIRVVDMTGDYSWCLGATAAAKQAHGALLMFLKPHMCFDNDILNTIDTLLVSRGAVVPEALSPDRMWVHSRGNLVIHRDLYFSSPGWTDETKLMEFLSLSGRCTRTIGCGLRSQIVEEGTVEPVKQGDYLVVSAGKVATFCMALKARSAIAIDSIRSLVTEENARFFDFIVSEDKSDDPLDLTTFPLAKYVTHFVVETGDTWNRSKLCNYGFRRARTPLVVSWDADFVFPPGFASTFLKDLVGTDFANTFLRIPVTETGFCKRETTRFNRGTLYGGMYVYGRKELLAINGYDESFLLYGHEEKDANSRMVLAGLKEKVVPRKGYVFHKSHDDALRGDMSNYGVNKQRAEDHVRKGIVKVNPTGWANAKRVAKPNYDKTIVIMGNGPSLKHFNFELMRSFDCIGMNIAYRHFRKIGIYPRFHTCFDFVVTDNHAVDFKAHIEDPDVTTERFFLLRQVSSSPKLTVIRLLPEAPEFSTDINRFQNSGNTGTNSCQVALCLGYRRIILIGVDCNYVQFVDGAKVVGGTVIEMQKTPGNNPNYFIPDYQQKGDRFNIPNAHIYHKPAWEKLAQYATRNGIDVVNCGPESALECFRRSTLEEEGIVV